MKSYSFRAEIERDEDGWLIRRPIMERYGGFAGGDTKEEAWNLIHEILQANIETMLELGIPVPEEPEKAVSSKDGQTFVSVVPKQRPVQRKGHSPKTYQFQMVIEPDEDSWFACCPTLEGQGAATCGKTL